MGTFESYCRDIDEILFQMRQLPDWRDQKVATEVRQVLKSAKVRRTNSMKHQIRTRGPQHEEAATALEEEMMYAGISPLYRIDNASNGLSDYGIRFTTVGVIEQKLHVPLATVQERKPDAYDLVSLRYGDVAFQRYALGNKPDRADRVLEDTQVWLVYAAANDRRIDELCAWENRITPTKNSPHHYSCMHDPHMGRRRPCKILQIHGEDALRLFTATVCEC